MSIPKLGLNEQQLSYLAFFKEGRGQAHKPRPDVYTRQNQYLVECDTLIKRLKQGWAALEKDSERFLTNFPYFKEEPLRRITVDGDNWCANKRSLDKAADNAARTYLPAVIAEERRLLDRSQRALEEYLVSAKHYLDLCAIEKEIVAAYKAKVRNYHAIESVYDRYQKLPAEIRGFIREEPQRMLNELMDKVQILHDFNRAMEDLGTRFAQFTQPVKSGTLVFAYGSWDTVKKSLAEVPAWIAAYKRLADWVDALNDENKTLLVGSNNATRTNSRNEYQTYAVAVPKMQRLLDESKLFYQACEVCQTIEKLSRDLNRKKTDVDRVQRACEALPAEAAKYVDSKIRSLLSSMLDSSDRLSQLELCVSALEMDFSKLPSDIKNGAPHYAYEKFETLQTTMSRVELWKESYSSMQRAVKELNGKVTFSTSLTQRINGVTSYWQKLTAATDAYDKMSKAYSYESRLVANADELKTNEKLALSFKRELENLPRDVVSLISAKWKTALDQAVVMHTDCRRLREQGASLESEYIELDRRAVKPSYSSYSACCSVADKYGTLEVKLKTLADDAAVFKKTYGTDGVSLESLRKYDNKLSDYCSTIERLKGCYELFQWARNYDAKPNRYNYSDMRTREGNDAYKEMTAMLSRFNMNRSNYLSFDTQGVMERVFASVDSRISLMKEAEDRRWAAKRRRRRAKLIASIVFSLLTLAVGVVLALIMPQHYGEGLYWLLLLVFGGVCVGNTFLVKWRFDHAFWWISTIVVYAAYAVLYSVPMYFYSEGSEIWYMSYLVMAVIATIVIVALVWDEQVSVWFMGGYGIAVSVLGIGIIIACIVVKFQDSSFFDGGFFGTIGNIFIAAWDIVVGLIIGCINVLGLVIGAGFWMPDLFGSAVVSGILNVVLYCFIGGVIGTGIVASARDAL